jgi:hypothetical protein
VVTEGLPPLVVSVLEAVRLQPDDVPLRIHVATLLLDAGHPAMALEHSSRALQLDADNSEARELIDRATRALAGEAPAPKPMAFDWTAAEAEVGEVVPVTTSMSRKPACGSPTSVAWSR